MSLEPRWERALNRYADTVYRLALLRERHPERAARETAAAFQALDWHTIALDDRLEGGLVAALPLPRRRMGRIGLRRSPHPYSRLLPPAFWRLPGATRLALGLRL